MPGSKELLPLFKGPQCKDMMKLSVQRVKVAKGQTDFLAGKDILYRQTLLWIICALHSFLDFSGPGQWQKEEPRLCVNCWAVSWQQTQSPGKEVEVCCKQLLLNRDDFTRVADFSSEKWNCLRAVSQSQNWCKYPRDHREIFWDICLDSCSNWEASTKPPVFTDGKQKYKKTNPRSCLWPSCSDKSNPGREGLNTHCASSLPHFSFQKPGCTVVPVLFCSAGVLQQGQHFPCRGTVMTPVLWLGEGRKSLSNSGDGPRSGCSKLKSPSGLQIMKLHWWNF